MEATDLLAREEEFKKLNKQLEKKTESLMKQIEHAMQKQDIFSEFSHNLTLSPHHISKKHYCDTPKSTPEQTTNNTPKSTPTIKKKKAPIKENNSNKEHDETESTKSNTNCDLNYINNTNSTKIICNCCAVSAKDRVHDDLEFLYAFVSVSVQENVLPQSFLKERATVENVCKFLSNKVQLMQEHIDKLQNTINKKASQCAAHLTKLAELESERMTLLHKTSTLQAAAADTRAKHQALMVKLEEKDRLYKEQRSETDKLASEAKRLRSKNASIEAKCATQEELIVSLKHQIDTAKISEKEFRDSTRSLSANHQNAISRLESRVKTLTTRNTRQEALILNLRKQIALLAATKAINAIESDYNTFLEAF
ncbi:testis-expressed protein 9-like [Hyposmocoma kahamanoa]|uniref:testis-expressed protein 9-like n=1 Tax=Hyposmocoma kahamanoa TaxID=1477025 RepID=UPI000E6D86C2|nr:testis-expressed protein 9-like [Hyposmocoma kahamanoa]